MPECDLTRSPAAHQFARSASFRFDVADELHVRHALAHASLAIAGDAALESFGFFACTADLEAQGILHAPPGD
jgi:hypothetical protein